MLTYHDLLNASNKEQFISKLIDEHRSTKEYHIAQTAEMYDRQQNVTINNYKKYLYKLNGQKIIDNISANYKLSSNYLHRFTSQLTQYLLSNGVMFPDMSIKEKLGNDFDTQLQKAGQSALIQRVSFGFWDVDKLKVFKFTEFAPLFDEENGGLRAGARFWQLAYDKPMRITFYEEDGYTEYIRPTSGEMKILKPKRAYKEIIKMTIADGDEIYHGENYPSFPIVPLYANEHKQSELVGMRANIDAYDLIKSGFANDLDGHLLYWAIKNAGGMDDVDIAKLLERIKTLGASISEDESDATPHQIDIPYESRVAYLQKLEDDMYKDFGALKVENISSSATTATQIKAAYMPLDIKANAFEFECIDFVRGILKLQGIDAVPQFKRDRISNESEQVTMILQASSYLDDETILKHLPFLSPDEIETILSNREKEEAARYETQKYSDTEEDILGSEEETEDEELVMSENEEEIQNKKKQTKK